MSDLNTFLFVLSGPLMMVAAGLIVFLYHMRQERLWAEEKRRNQTPAE